MDKYRDKKVVVSLCVFVAPLQQEIVSKTVEVRPELSFHELSGTFWTRNASYTRRGALIEGRLKQLPRRPDTIEKSLRRHPPVVAVTTKQASGELSRPWWRIGSLARLRKIIKSSPSSYFMYSIRTFCDEGNAFPDSWYTMSVILDTNAIHRV
jgi:hypothetical protein